MKYDKAENRCVGKLNLGLGTISSMPIDNYGRLVEAVQQTQYDGAIAIECPLFATTIRDEIQAAEQHLAYQLRLPKRWRQGAMLVLDRLPDTGDSTHVAGFATLERGFNDWFLTNLWAKPRKAHSEPTPTARVVLLQKQIDYAKAHGVEL